MSVYTVVIKATVTQQSYSIDGPDSYLQKPTAPPLQRFTATIEIAVTDEMTLLLYTR